MAIGEIIAEKIRLNVRFPHCLNLCWLADLGEEGCIGPRHERNGVRL